MLVICIIFSTMYSGMQMAPVCIQRTENVTENVWQPTNGSRSDWLKCHGLPCDLHDQINAKLWAIEQIQSSIATGKPKPLKDILGRQNKSDITHPLHSKQCMILMTEEQTNVELNNAIKALRLTRDEILSGKTERKMENFQKWPNAKWKNQIPYKFDGKHSDREKKIIRRAFKQWEENTCVRFVELPVHRSYKYNHILVTNQGDGCYSYVGRVSLIPQQLNLADRCLPLLGIAVHEVGHSLGLFHEQQRPDRDLYIQVRTKNINQLHSQFTIKYGADTGGVPYDMGSVMHYAGNAVSKNAFKLNTMESIDPLFQRTMGQRTGLSFLDAQAINNRYCSGVCKPGDLRSTCRRRGYQDPNACYRCMCPDGFGGRYCEEIGKPKGATCGGKIDLSSGQEATVKSPRYGPRRYYHDMTECNWLIKAPSHHRVWLTFKGNFGFYCYHLKVCFHWLEVRYGRDLGLPGPRFCCYQRPTKTLKSKNEEMVLILRSNYPTEWKSVRVGFQATARAVPIAPTGPRGGTRVTTEEIPTAPPTAGTKATIRATTTTTTTTTPTTATRGARTRRPTTHPKTVKVKTTKLTPTKIAGAMWGRWGPCQKSMCKCGGHSVQKRYRMCGRQRCTGADERMDERPCDRFCTKKDLTVVYIGKFFKVPCAICHKHYDVNYKAGKCTPRFSPDIFDDIINTKLLHSLSLS